MALREPRDILHRGLTLDQILDAHGRWVLNEEGGIQASLAGAKLFGARLRNAILPLASLSGADLHKAVLAGAILAEAELVEIDLREADLRDANLCGAVLTRAQLHRADLRGADLRNAILDGSDLLGANLQGARLQGASLAHARLYRTDLRGADVSHATLAEAELIEAMLGGARLEETDLTAAKLVAVDLRGARLARIHARGAKFEQVCFGHTHVLDCDLKHAMGIETARHLGPIWIEPQTPEHLEKCFPAAFLRDAGIAGSATEPAPASSRKDAGDIWMIAHAQRDADFAGRLRADLLTRRVACWLLPEDVSWEGIDLSRPAYDRLLLVCSRHSLASARLMSEVWCALDREARGTGKPIVYPLRIDDYLFTGWDHARKLDLLHKSVGDFRNWRDRELYLAALNLLLAELRPPDSRRAEAGSA